MRITFNLSVTSDMSDADWAELPKEERATAARTAEIYWRTVSILAGRLYRQYHELSEKVAEADVMSETPDERRSMLNDSVPELVAFLRTDDEVSAMIWCSRVLADQTRKLYEVAEKAEERWRSRADDGTGFLGEAGMY